MALPGPGGAAPDGDRSPSSARLSPADQVPRLSGRLRRFWTLSGAGIEALGEGFRLRLRSSTGGGLPLSANDVGSSRNVAVPPTAHASAVTRLTGARRLGHLLVAIGDAMGDLGLLPARSASLSRYA